MAKEVLIGREATILVGEPWDFSSTDGENRLKAKISGVRRRLFGGNRVELRVTPFEVRGARYETLLASCRYQEDGDVVRRLTRGGQATVNLYAESRPRSPVLIGELTLDRL